MFYICFSRVNEDGHVPIDGIAKIYIHKNVYAGIYTYIYDVRSKNKTDRGKGKKKLPTKL